MPSSLTGMSRDVAIVPHSHWDREWYAPFESYRVRLVSMLDQLLDLMESDSGYQHFHLDGQMAVVDDYLEARPEGRTRIEKLILDGRLAVGPWYVLMDEFCVSGETILRNLQLGLARARDFTGGASPTAPPVGYLPDMFGHVAQMPQILRQAGMADAVVWRGVPAAVGSRAFAWQAPDGSRVRAEYLPVGYAAGAFLPKDAASLVRRIEAHEAEIASFTGPDGPLLFMNGGDHQSPQPWLPRLLEEANRVQDRFRFRQTGLAEFVGQMPVEGLPAWSGELRSGARAPVLMGVLSNRVDVKQAAAATETALERLAEPLAALWLPPGLWPEDLLDRAWLEVIRNSAHDSICACSADAVVRTVLHRYDSARAVAEAVQGSATDIARVATAAAGPLLLNPLPFTRSGVVELELPGTVAPDGTQQLSVAPAATVERRGRGRDLATILGQLTEDGWLGTTGRGVDAELDPGDPLVLTIHQDATRSAEPAMAPVMAEAWARAGAGRDEPLTVRVVRAPSQRVAARVADVPGWGWAMWTSAPASHEPVVVEEQGSTFEVGNGLCRIAVDRSDGTFSLDGVGGQNLIVEEGDEGDTYNYSPAPDRPAVASPDRVDVHVLERGPVRAVVRVVRVYRWDPPTEVVSDLEIRAGEAVVRITTSFDHRSRDHRVRAVFPIGAVAEGTEAECAFGTAVRNEAEGGPHEPPLATFPSRRFVTAGETTLTHQGLLEYELTGGGGALALTLLRATGILSRPAPPARPNVAGPALELRDAQLPGPQTFRYAVARRCPDRWALADATWTPLIAVTAGGHGHLPDRGSRLRLSGAQVSSLRRSGGAIEIRVFNPAPTATTVHVPDHSGTLVDLRGETVGSWDGSFELGPWAFTTARLAADSLD